MERQGMPGTSCLPAAPAQGGGRALPSQGARCSPRPARSPGREGFRHHLARGCALDATVRKGWAWGSYSGCSRKGEGFWLTRWAFLSPLGWGLGRAQAAWGLSQSEHAQAPAGPEAGSKPSSLAARTSPCGGMRTSGARRPGAGCLARAQGRSLGLGGALCSYPELDRLTCSPGSGLSGCLGILRTGSWACLQGRSWLSPPPPATGSEPLGAIPLPSAPPSSGGGGLEHN